MKEANLRRLDHERHEHEEMNWGSSLTGRVRGYVRRLGELLQRKDVLAATAGLGMAVAAGIGIAAMKPRKKSFLGIRY